MGVRHLAEAFSDLGILLPDASLPTDLYNDNQSCVIWANSTTTKGIRHMELRKNSVRELVNDKCLRIIFVPGKYNPSDIFTKEMKDASHFRILRDSFMSSASTFLQASLAEVFRRQSSLVS